MNNDLLKYSKYKSKYYPNEIYWGLGIENELYLEFEIKKNINKDFFIKNHNIERYRIDYFSNYNTLLFWQVKPYYFLRLYPILFEEKYKWY